MLVAAVAMVVSALPAQADPDVDTSRLRALEAELERLEQEVRDSEGAVGDLDARAEELRRDAAAAQVRLEEIEAELSLAVERYNEAVVALEEVQAQRAGTVDELAIVAGEVDTLEARVADHARRLHKLGPSVEFASLFGAGDSADIGFKGSSLRRILTGEQVDLEELGAARARLNALEARLADEEAAADAAAARVEDEVAEVEATFELHEDELAELTAVLDRVEAEEAAERARLAEGRAELVELHDAVEAERANVAAERERREQERREQERREQERREQERREAQRREAAAAAAASSAASSPSTSSSGGSTSSGSPSKSSSSSSSGPRRSAQVAVDTALAQVGKPYRWGATGPNAYDCSGLTSYAWKAAGVTIPRTSGAQYAGLKPISRSQLQPGDLVFYNSPISHVAMYVGNNTIVEASRTGIPVRTASLSNRNPVGYRRP